MKENENNEESSAKPEKPKAEGSNKNLFFGILGGVLILNTIVAYVMIMATRPKNVEENHAKLAADSLKHVEESTTEMGATTAEAPIEVVVNIAGTDGERFLKMAVIFEFDDNLHPELLEAIEKREPKFKYMLIDLLTKLTLVELTEPDAKERIRKEFLRLVNTTLPEEEGHIRDVMITSFIIQ